MPVGVAMWEPGTVLQDDETQELFYVLSEPAPWWFGGGQLLWLPSLEAATAMGLSAEKIKPVPSASLADLPKSSLFTHPETFLPLKPSLPSPGSFWLPPSSALYWWDPPGQAKWWPRLDVPGITLANGAQVTEIRGWLIYVGPGVNTLNATAAVPCGQDCWHLWIVPDPVWCDRIGVDWATFIKLGDLFNRSDAGTPPALPGSSADSTVFAAVPVIEMEPTGWPTTNWLYTATTPPPNDWLVPITSSKCTGMWPFMPSADTVTGEQLNLGDYVRVVGSIVTDSPHNVGPSAWTLGLPEHDPFNPARWTEIHPPDLIEQISDPGLSVTLYGMALIASPGKEQSGTFTFLAPPRPRAPNAKLVVREFVGPETIVTSIRGGNSTNTGAAITIGPDSATVHIAVYGEGGNNGQFKGVYLLSWEVEADISYLFPLLLGNDAIG